MLHTSRAMRIAVDAWPAAFWGSKARHAASGNATRHSRTVRFIGSCKIGAQTLAQQVDGYQRTVRFEMPERPAVAGIQSLNMGGDAMDRSRCVRTRKRTIGAHLRM